MRIDTSFDVRSDAFGRDPDAHSATLRRYHQMLWSKVLPGGTVFDLDMTTPGAYLHHRSALGEFFLSSDSFIPTFTSWIALKPITSQLSEEANEAFRAIGYTIGGMIVWPANRVDRMMTINGARGFNRKIADRMDLTLECVRRHYLGQASPLGDVLARHSDFFVLFQNFLGYVDFFLLQDLVNDDLATVKFFLPFDNFATPSVPRDIATYMEYRSRSIEFVAARNLRIDQLVFD